MIPVPAAAVRSSKSAADGEHMKIKLQTVIDAIEQASDAYTMLYDTKTNETVYLPDAWVTGETDEALAALVENEPKRFLHFPTKYDIHEYSIMDSFVDYLPPGRMKNILIIQGGGRPNGNTAQLVEHFARGAKEAGHTVEVISLRKQEVKGCMGCNACRYGKPCVQKDSFNELVPKIKDADCIVFASPLLFWTISAQLKALIERFYCIAEEDPNPPLGRYEKYPSKDCALLMTSADNFFWTFEQAVSYYQFTLVNYIGFHDRGMLLAGGCGDTNGKPQIDKTDHLQEAYEFGKHIY